MKGLHPADVTVLVVYLLGVTCLGLWMSRRVKSMGDFFMPRHFGPITMMMHAFGTGTASDQAVTVASGTAQNGLSGIWFQWLWLIPTPFYWLIAPIMRRFRAVTTADILTLRFDQSVAVLFAVVGVLSMSIKIGVILLGAATVLDAGTGGALNHDVAIYTITVLFLIYGIAGGLSAAIVTDFIQGILTIVFSFLLLPFVMSAVGGMSGVREQITDKSLLSLVAPGNLTTFYVTMLGLQGLVGIVAQPHIMGVCAAGKTENEGRIGFMFGNLIKRLCTVAWCLTGIAAVAWYMQQDVPLETIQSKAFADRIYGDIAHTFLPQIMPGLLGIFLASLLAAVMSSCDSFMISSAGLFAENIYKPLRPNQSVGHYLTVSRITSLVVVAGGVWFAFNAQDVVQSLEIWFKISPMTGIVFWMSLFWRRMTVAGAWATTLTGFGAWWLATRAWFAEWVSTFSFAESWHMVDETADGISKIYEPAQIVFYLSLAAMAGVVVSLLTPRVDEKRLNLFHALLRTPVQPDEIIEQPCTLPTDIQIPMRPLGWKFGDIEVPRPSKTSLIGFAGGSLFAILLVITFLWYAKTG